MVAFACFSFLCGAVLAQRFVVLVLLPAILFGALATVIAGGAAGYDAWTILLSVCVVAVTMQLGYLAGMFARTIITALRTSRKAGDAESKARPQAA